MCVFSADSVKLTPQGRQKAVWQDVNPPLYQPCSDSWRERCRVLTVGERGAARGKDTVSHELHIQAFPVRREIGRAPGRERV